MTSVEEWTRAEIGVGAAMAAGSHLEKGIWALLVIAARITNEKSRLSGGERWVISQCPWCDIRPMVIRRHTSPNRLVRAVIIPPDRAVEF